VEVFRVLPKADPRLAGAWWVMLILRGVLPAVFAIAMGVLVGAVQRGDALAGPLTLSASSLACSRCSRPFTRPWARTSATEPRPGSTTG